MIYPICTARNKGVNNSILTFFVLGLSGILFTKPEVGDMYTLIVLSFVGVIFTTPDCTEIDLKPLEQIQICRHELSQIADSDSSFVVVAVSGVKPVIDALGNELKRAFWKGKVQLSDVRNASHLKKSFNRILSQLKEAPNDLEIRQQFIECLDSIVELAKVIQGKIEKGSEGA